MNELPHSSFRVHFPSWHGKESRDGGKPWESGPQGLSLGTEDSNSLLIRTAPQFLDTSQCPTPGCKPKVTGTAELWPGLHGVLPAPQRAAGPVQAFIKAARPLTKPPMPGIHRCQVHLELYKELGLATGARAVDREGVGACHGKARTGLSGPFVRGVTAGCTASCLHTDVSKLVSQDAYCQPFPANGVQIKGGESEKHLDPRKREPHWI